MLVAVALFGVGLALPVPAMADSYEGTWHVHGQMRAPNGQVLASIAPVCQLQQRGNQLSGQCTGPSARGPASGIVNGDNATWEWTATATNSNGQDGVAVFRSTIGNDNIMRGTFTGSSQPGMTGTFTAQ
ncbi:MAG TPA: hypothetical protein VHY35_08950 [Stellaceae bacterium]|jgi:hypothetical protein|nr:hypothetical protein [Stellaceae bacterium]